MDSYLHPVLAIAVLLAAFWAVYAAPRKPTPTDHYRKTYWASRGDRNK